MKKRLLCIIMALALCLSLLPATALAGGTRSYSIENGTLVISGTTNGSDLPTEGFTSIKITETGVVTGGTYTVNVENYGTITGGEFGFVMNRNGGAGNSLAMITGGTFEEVSNYGNMTGGTVNTLSNIETTNTQHTVQGVTVTGSLHNNNSNCSDMTLNIPLDQVTNNLSITTVRQVVNGTEVLCPVGQNAASWLKSNVADADWYQLNGKKWVKLTDTDVFPCEKSVYSKIPGMSLGTMGSMQDIISGNWIVPVADSENSKVINPVFNGKIGVFNSSAVWYVDSQPVEGKFSPPAMSYTVTEGDIGKDAVAKLTDGYATIQSPTIRIVKSLSVTVPATSAVGETITPVFNWQLKTNYSEGMTYQWQRDGADIEGANSDTYTATESDRGCKLTLKIFVKGKPYYITDKVAIAALHTHSWATEWSKDETYHWHECTADGCDVTGNAQKDGYAAHTYDQEIATDDYKASVATCTTPATYYKSCICGAKGTETFESGEVNASNHTGTLSGWQTDPDNHWKAYSCCGATVEEGDHTASDWITDTAATATTDGTKYKKCTVCHRVLEIGTIPATGYTITFAITVESAKNGAVTVAPKTASKGTTVTLTVEPDKGYTLETITVTDKNGNEIELTNKGDGKYTFKMPGSKVTVKATFMEDNSMLNFFVDVFPGDYYYDAVLWAAENGITGGVDDTHFAPNATCTRAQVVTFLWRAAGSPEPESLSSLSDVPADAYYAKAVAWALENGITTGTGNGTFTPNAVCSRGQIVTFLWRALGETSGAAAPFADVAADAYYALAVAWAVANGVTSGTSDTTFSPSANCTRAQIVTFLYRCLGDE